MPIPVKHLFNVKSRVGLFHFGNFFRRAFRNNGAAAGTAFRAKVDNVIGLQDDIEVVLDHKGGIALIHQPLNHLHQLFNIRKMQSRCRLVQNIERLARLCTVQFLCQFHALSFAAGKRGSRLTQMNVAKAYIVQRLKFLC